MKHPYEPPRWAHRLLVWYCKPEILEDLEGDLHEYFERNCRTKGVRKARIIYTLDVLKFFRIYTIRKPEFLNLLIHWIMVSSYIKTSSRNIVKNKLFSFINIFGLALSMSVGLIMIAMLKDALSFDKFHQKHDRIFRVITDYHALGEGDARHMATTSHKAGNAIKESMAGIEDLTILKGGLRADVTHDDKTIPLTGFWADESFFKVFSFNLVQGNSATVLKDPFSLILTEKSALKIFGDADALGKTVSFDDETQYTVTGIVQDVPRFSHFKFDMLASLSTRSITQKEDAREMLWNNVWSNYVYMVLRPDADLVSLQTNLNTLTEEENKTIKNATVALSLQALDGIVTGQNRSNQPGPILGKTTLWILGSLALVVILSACFNYTNLSIARAFRRSREVGIRKSIGASKSQVIFQFITESIIISLLSLIIAIGLFVFIRPHFISMEYSLQELLQLDLSFELIGLFIVFAIVIGCLAGLIPAFFFGRINAIQVLKNMVVVNIFKGVTLRKVLLVVQYCISIIAITATLIIYKQYSHFVAYDLGFTTENIVNIELQGNKAQLLQKELELLPEVKEISRSLTVTSIGNYYGTHMFNPKNPLDSGTIFYNSIDEKYLALHDHKLLAGRNFSPKADSTPDNEIIVNMGILKRFNIANQNPIDAIDEIVKVDGKEMKIIGVIKDFEFGRANNKNSKEFAFRFVGNNAEYLNVKISSSDWLATRAKVESIWKKIDPVHQLEARFYNEQIEEAFAGLKAAIKLGGFLAILVITIASVGLLGMVVFTTETRLKEISIRKVLGATEGKLLYHLGKNFVILLLIAIMIALPVTYLFFTMVLLPEIANHAPIGLLEMAGGVVAVMSIAIVMIASQTLKVARINPAEVLKTE